MHRNQTRIPMPALAIQSLGIGLGPTVTPKIFPDCCRRQDRLPSVARATIADVFLNGAPSIGRVQPKGGLEATAPLVGGVHYTLTKSPSPGVQGTRT
jgi:hypothetical protein